jgi:hypothetical protein
MHCVYRLRHRISPTLLLLLLLHVLVSRLSRRSEVEVRFGRGHGLRRGGEGDGTSERHGRPSVRRGPRGRVERLHGSTPAATRHGRHALVLVLGLARGRTWTRLSRRMVERVEVRRLVLVQRRSGRVCRTTEWRRVLHVRREAMRWRVLVLTRMAHVKGRRLLTMHRSCVRRVELDMWRIRLRWIRLPQRRRRRVVELMVDWIRLMLRRVSGMPEKRMGGRHHVRWREVCVTRLRIHGQRHGLMLLSRGSLVRNELLGLRLLFRELLGLRLRSFLRWSRSKRRCRCVEVRHVHRADDGHLLLLLERRGLLACRGSVG